MYNWKKDVVSWKMKKNLYLSVVFSWQVREAELMARVHNGPVIAGGPAIDSLGGVPWAECPGRLSFDIDILAMHNPLATFTSRGCTNRCKFCIVPIMEGALTELATWKHAPVICDNNITACSETHFVRVIDSLMPFPYADFNQGLSARLFNEFHAKQLARLNGVKVRFALDHTKEEAAVESAIELARSHGLKDFAVYVLFGFDDTPEDAVYRMEKVRSWKVLPYPMRYQPLTTLVKGAHVSPNWTAYELQKVKSYYSDLIFGGWQPYSDFKYQQSTAIATRDALEQSEMFGGDQPRIEI